MKLKRTQADKWFSDCVRERANWACENCGKDHANDKQNLHCSHFVSRSHLATRYHPKNAMAHCITCHEYLGGGRWGGGNVAEFANHFDSIFSAKTRDMIRILSKDQFRKHKLYIKELSKFYRDQHKLMLLKRGEGDHGRIEFDFFNGSLELNALEKEARKNARARAT